MSQRSRVLICTRDDRLIVVSRDNGTWSTETLLEDVPAQCVAADGARVLVGTRDRGALLSTDRGVSWETVELPEPQVHSVAISAADGALYAGTEPSRLFVSRDGGPWAELRALQNIPSRDRWSFPPRPWTHHVRWIAPDPHNAERLLVGIELGGLMYSDDAGATFSDHRPGAKRDVHSVVWHPHAVGRAYQAAGDGAAWSHDAGVSWDGADAGRELGYCWAVAVDAADPECWYVSAAAGPGAAHSGERARGRLYRWRERSWEALALPDASMPYALAVTGEGLFAALADGRLFLSTDRGERWLHTGIQTGAVLAVAAG
jgi:photosystem II stability/assembly factor-like uncharacterized protein